MNDQQIIDNVFADLSYTMDANTTRVVTDHLLAAAPYFRAEELRTARDWYRPGDSNPWALNVRKFLDYRANLIEGGE